MSGTCKKNEKDTIPTVQITIREKGLEAAYRFLAKKVVEEMGNSKKCEQPFTSG